jgi:hypothetical protein
VTRTDTSKEAAHLFPRNRSEGEPFHWFALIYFSDWLSTLTLFLSCVITVGKMKRDRSKYCHFQQEKCRAGSSERQEFKIRLLQAAPFRNVSCHYGGYLKTFKGNAYSHECLCDREF